MRPRTRRTHELPQPVAFVRDDAAVDILESGPLPLIDEGLRQYASRGLVSSAEILDLLLELRSVIAFDAAFATLLDRLERR